MLNRILTLALSLMISFAGFGPGVVSAQSMNMNVAVSDGSSIMAIGDKTTATAYLPNWNGPVVNVVNYIPSYNSVTIQFVVPAGVSYQDIRVFQVNASNAVKYGGSQFVYDQYGNYESTEPSSQVQYNGLAHAVDVTLVAQAVNMLGPPPYQSMYNADNVPVTNPHNLLGSNMGLSLDGLMSTNGQGAIANNPQVIAQSLPFTVCANAPLPYLASPVTGESQDFIETFQAAMFGSPDQIDPSHGHEHFIMQADKSWDVTFDLADLDDSKVFVTDDHMMWTLFDGGTPSVSGQPLHQGHGVVAFSPAQSFIVPPGAILEMDAEVDDYFEPRDWCSFFVYPANDSPTRFYPITNCPNVSGNEFEIDNQGLNMQMWETTCNQSIASLFGEKLAYGSAASPGEPEFAQCPVATNASGNAYWIPARAQNGNSYDKRHRLTMFLSDSQVEYVENGVPVVGQDSVTKTLTTAFTIPGGLTWMDAAPVKFSLGGWTYHTAQRVADEDTYSPYNTFRINVFPYSGERHVDLIGARVLPAGTTWASLAAFCQPSNPELPGTPAPPVQTVSGTVAAASIPSITLAIGGITFTFTTLSQEITILQDIQAGVAPSISYTTLGGVNTITAVK